VTTLIQADLSAAYANLPRPWLNLSPAEADALGDRLSGRIYAIRPPLPSFPLKDIQEELGRLEKRKYSGRPHE
jgi:hypothetical protein